MRRLAASLSAAAWLPAACAWGLQSVARCPEGSRPARTPDPQAPWACVLSDERYRSGADCPAGAQPLAVSGEQAPVQCALAGIRVELPRGSCPPGEQAVPTAQPDKEYECEAAGSSFRAGPRCPKGYAPVPTPGRLQPFRCERAVESAASPGGARGEGGARAPRVARCPAGTERRVTEDPFEPVRCVPKESAAQRLPSAAEYRRYRVPPGISFEYPGGWHMDDAWKEEAASLYLRFDPRRDGRSVSVTLSRRRRSEPGYVDMSAAAQREKSWHAAQEEGREPVAGRPALHLSTQGESKTAFIRTQEGYLVLAYAAPADSFERYLPVYRRMLQSLRLDDGL